MSKSIKKNYLYNTAYSILNMLLPLVMAPYLSRVLGVSGIGQYAYCYSVAQYFVLVAKLGLTNYGTREISKTKNHKEKSELFTNLFAMQVISSIIVFLLYYVYVFALSGENFIIAAIFAPWVLLSFLDIDWFWFGEEEFQKVSIRNIIIKILSIISIFLLVRSEDDLSIYALIMLISFILGYASIWIGIRKRVSFCNLSFKITKKHFKPCLTMLIPVLALSIYRSMDKVMLGAMSGMRETGLYENGEKLVYCLSALISSLGSVMLPRMSYLVRINNQAKIQAYIRRSMKFIIFLTSAMAFGLMSISNTAMGILFGEEFLASGKILFLCAPTLIFMGWSNVIRTQYIIPHRKDPIYIKSIMLGAIINLILNAILIPRFGATGAAIGTICAELFVPLFQFAKLKNELPYKKYLCDVIAYVIIGFFMFAIIKLVQLGLNSSILSLVIQILLGATTYCGLCIFYTRTFDTETYNKIKRMILKRRNNVN